MKSPNFDLLYWSWVILYVGEREITQATEFDIHQVRVNLTWVTSANFP
jgi:hypothetical protein